MDFRGGMCEDACAKINGTVSTYLKDGAGNSLRLIMLRGQVPELYVGLPSALARTCEGKRVGLARMCRRVKVAMSASPTVGTLGGTNRRRIPST